MSQQQLDKQELDLLMQAGLKAHEQFVTDMRESQLAWAKGPEAFNDYLKELVDSERRAIEGGPAN